MGESPSLPRLDKWRALHCRSERNSAIEIGVLALDVPAMCKTTSQLAAKEADDANLRRPEPLGLCGHERRDLLLALPGTAARLCNGISKMLALR